MNVIVKSDHDQIIGDNITGASTLIVPNIVHNVLFGYNEMKFSHFISLLSVIMNQKPDIIYIHCDCTQLTGDYYQRFLQKLSQTNTSFIIRTIEQPTQIFGVNISKQYLNWHSSDITRLRVLQEFGGIYLDNDVYVVKCLDKLRKFEMTLNRDDFDYISNGVLIANKNARFIQLWIESYRDYDPDQWFYNGGVLPTKLILEVRPYLVHRLRGEFAVFGPIVCPMLYSSYYENWRTDFYVIHLLMRGNEITFPDWCMNGHKLEVNFFNETIVQQMNSTFGEMFRDLLYF